MTTQPLNVHIFGNDLTVAHAALTTCLMNIEKVGRNIIERGGGVEQGDEIIIPLDNAGLRHERIKMIAFPKDKSFLNMGTHYKIYKNDCTTLEPYQLSIFVVRNVAQELVALHDKM